MPCYDLGSGGGPVDGNWMRSSRGRIYVLQFCNFATLFFFDFFLSFFAFFSLGIVIAISIHILNAVVYRYMHTVGPLKCLIQQKLLAKDMEVKSQEELE